MKQAAARVSQRGRRGTPPSRTHWNAMAASVAIPKAAKDRYLTGNRNDFNGGISSRSSGYTGVERPNHAIAHTIMDTGPKTEGRRPDDGHAAASSDTRTPADHAQ